MPNRYYSENHPEKGAGKKDAMRTTQKAATKAPAGLPDVKFAAAPDNVKKEGMGFGNKASTKQRRGSADCE